MAPTRTTLRKLADDFMALYVKHRGGWVCQGCGSREWWRMQCAHLMAKRNYRATRFREDNAICLCDACHAFYTPRPVEWREWLLRRMGKERLERLELEARVRCGPHDYVAVVVFYWFKLRERPDLDKIVERFRELERRARNVGIPLSGVTV